MKDDFDLKYFSKLDGFHERAKEELALITPYAKGHILDVGCGKGIIEKHFPDVVSTDISAEAKKYIKGEFHQCSMIHMPFKDESFDTVFCLHVIAHIEEGQRAIDEAYRVLKRGGQLVVITPNKYYVYLSWLATFLRHWKFKYDITAKWLYSISTIFPMFRKFRLVEHRYFQQAPKTLPFEFLRAKILVVATK